MFGVLAIDKPAGMTSRDVVNRIQRITRPIKVGHTGTLDPLATGVLLLALGSATRLVEFSHEADKTYEAVFELGKCSDTLDIEGNVVACPEPPSISLVEYRTELQRWVGLIEQVPPKYSAVNLQGRRAHELARRGEIFELPSRKVQVHSIDLLNFAYPQVGLRIRCGTGTYIRSLGSDIGRSLGSDAIMTRLVRTAIGDVRLSDCVSLDSLKSLSDVRQHLLPPQTLLSTFPRTRLTTEGARRIRNGIALCVTDLTEAPTVCADRSARHKPEQWLAEDLHGNLVAVLCKEGEHYRSLRVFQNTHDTSQPNPKSIPHSPES